MNIATRSIERFTAERGNLFDRLKDVLPPIGGDMTIPSTTRSRTITPSRNRYQQYEAEKRKIQALGLAPAEYERRIVTLAAELKI